jgi:nucleoside-diphosphate-sugar epimerase
MRILITGGSGYLGSVLTHELLGLGHHVTVLDNLMYKQDGLVSLCHNPNFNFVHGDVRDQVLLGKLAEQSEVIFPLAAIVGFPACERDKQLATDVNYRHVLFLARNSYRPGQKLIYPNTNSGYGVGKDGECVETDKLLPISHYGITKCAAEHVIKDHTDGITLRLATVFGTSPRMRLDLLVNDFTYKAATDGYVVLFEKDFKRNYVHIRDVVSAFIFMMNNYDRLKKETFNLGLSEANLTKLELCRLIKKHVPNFSIQCDDIREDPDKRNYIVSNAKVEQAGWKASIGVEQGVQELLKAYRIIKPASVRYGNA